MNWNAQSGIMVSKVQSSTATPTGATWTIRSFGQFSNAPKRSRFPSTSTPPRLRQPVIQASYTGNFAPGVTAQLAAAGWGWHIETAIHVLRIILSGAFDRYPHLQLVIGHLGEALPFMLPRLDHNLPRQLTRLERPIGAYLRENVFYTFSGFNFTPNFLDLLFQVGVDRIMFSADYPYSSMLAARNFLEQLALSPADINRIAHGNAEHLFHM